MASGFQIAKLEGLDLKDPFLKTLLDTLPSDNEWNPEVPREKALLQAGEMRYLYEATDLSSKAKSTVEKDYISGGTDGGSAQKALLMDPAAAGSVNIKVEEGAVTKQNKMSVLRAAKKKMEQYDNQLQDLIATAAAQANNHVKNIAQQCLQKLSTQLLTLRNELAIFDKTTTFSEEDTKKADDLAIACEAHTDGSKRAISKCRNLLS